MEGWGETQEEKDICVCVCVCVCTQLTHIVVQQKPTQHCKAITFK